MAVQGLPAFAESTLKLHKGPIMNNILLALHSEFAMTELCDT